MERAERMVVLGVGLTLGYLTAALWVLLVLTGVTVVQRFLLVWRQATPATERPARPSWWITARDARTDESRLAGWRPAARPPGERSRLANWILSARPPAGEGKPPPARPWRSFRSGNARGFGGVARDDIAGVRSQLRRLRNRTRP
jgi:hypothetical protein